MVQQYLCSLEHFNTWHFDTCYNGKHKKILSHYRVSGYVPIDYTLEGAYIAVQWCVGRKPPLFVQVFVNGILQDDIQETDEQAIMQMSWEGWRKYSASFTAEQNDHIKVDSNNSYVFIVMRAIIPDDRVVGGLASWDPNVVREVPF